MIINLTVELTIGLVALLIAVKIIGKRQLRQVAPFDFISALVLGELLGNAIYDDETNLFYMLYGVALWTLLLYIIEKATQKSTKARRVIEGSPDLIIKNGLIDYNVLKKEKLDFSELISLLREKDIFSVKEVEYAVLEPNGAITVIKNSLYATPTKKDLKVTVQPSQLSLPLIVDGIIEKSNLKMTGYDENWLKEGLNQFDIKDLKEVLYAEWNINDGFHIQKKFG